MAAMKSVRTGAPGRVESVGIERPVPGPRDALLRVRACGICGTDVTFPHLGGPPRDPQGRLTAIPLGHEPAGEIVAVGADVTDLKAGDHVVVNAQGAPTGIIGCGAETGGMSEYLLIRDATVGRNVSLLPDTVPFDVAALNAPIALARHCIDRSQAKPTDKVVVFGAGPTGLGAVIWLKLRGVAHVVAADVIPEHLETALAVGADAVIDSSCEDVTARLTELHGQGSDALGRPCPDTDLYIASAGIAVISSTAMPSAKCGGKLVTVAVHKKPEPLDHGAVLRSEMTIIVSQSYPTETFDATEELAEYQDRFARLISHLLPTSQDRPRPRAHPAPRRRLRRRP